MTGKRFTYDTTDLNFEYEIEGLVSLFYDNDKQMTYAEVLNKLNELHEENQQFHEWLDTLRELLLLADRDNTALEKENKELKVTTGEMEDYLARMEEENKHLKKEVKEYKEAMKRMMIDMMRG